MAKSKLPDEFKEEAVKQVIERGYTPIRCGKSNSQIQLTPKVYQLRFSLAHTVPGIGEHLQAQGRKHI